MPELNRIAVIVLNWNGAAIIKRCLESLINQSFKNLQIIVVDNGSTDASKEILEAEKKHHGEKLQLIYNDRNLGFAGGVNVGFKYVLENNFEAVALLNNDARASPDWLNHLAGAMSDRPKVGIVTGLLLNENGTRIDSTGDWYSIWGLAFPRNRDEPTEKAAESGYVFGATGGASLYRIKMLKEIGLFDENFFAYYEDVDLCWRAQLANWKVFYTKEAVAYHKRGATSEHIAGFTTYQTLKNLPMLFVKNVPSYLLLSVGLRFGFIYWAVFLNRSWQGNFLPALKGVLAAIRNLPVCLGERRQIQSRIKVTPSYLQSILWPELPPTHKRLKRWRQKIFGR